MLPSFDDDDDGGGGGVWLIGGPFRDNVSVFAAVSAGYRIRCELPRQREAPVLVLVGHRYDIHYYCDHYSLLPLLALSYEICVYSYER